jgi:hypothetical protein
MSVDMTENPEQQRLDVLHDHYKESFSHVREREKQRDWLFLILIGLFALLSLQILYPADFGGALGPTPKGLRRRGGPQRVAPPGAAQRVLGVHLRDRVEILPGVHQHREAVPVPPRPGGEDSAAIGDRDLYRREGRAYLHNYPLFSDWAWFCYVFLFPAIVALAILALSIGEWAMLPHHWLYKSLDSVVAAAILISFSLYRILPLFTGRSDGTDGNAGSESKQ